MAMELDTKTITTLYDVIVISSEAARLPEAAREFAEAFLLPGESTLQILKSAPIVFATGLKRSELRAIKSGLLRISTCGVEFKISTKPTPEIPRVVWGTRPSFETLGEGCALPAPGFHLGTAGFTCPSCGEVMVVRQIGKPVLHPTAATPSAPSPAHAAARAPARAAASLPAKKEAPKKAPREESLDIVDEPLTLDDVASIEEGDDPALDLVEPVEEIAEIEEVVEEIPKKKGGRVSKGQLKTVGRMAARGKAKEEPLELEETEVVPELEEESAPKPVPSRISADGEPLFSVFLSQIADPARQAEAARLISEIRGIPLKEAKDKVKGTLIPVLKDVTKAEADACLDKFQKMKIAGKVTAKKK